MGNSEIKYPKTKEEYEKRREEWEKAMIRLRTHPCIDILDGERDEYFEKLCKDKYPDMYEEYYQKK